MKSSEAKLFEHEEKEMSDTERTKVSAALAEIDQEIKSVKQEKRDINSKYRVRINDLEKRQDVLSRQIIDGVVELSFEVTEQPDDEALKINVIRKDNDEKISSRPMTEPEKEAARKRKQLVIAGTEDDGGVIDDDAIPAGAVRAGRSSKTGSKRKGGKK